MTKLEQTLQSIRPVDNALYREAQRRLDNLTKPQGSLGNLEEFAARVVAITGKMEPTLEKKAIFTFAGDHGVAEEGVSAFPKEVTAQMVINFLNGGAGINVLASHVGAEVVVIDVGVDGDFEEAEGLVRRKVVRGTGNIRRGGCNDEGGGGKVYRGRHRSGGGVCREGVSHLRHGRHGYRQYDTVKRHLRPLYR